MKVAIFNDTRTTSHYGCMLVMRNLLKELQDAGIEVSWTYPVSTDWRKNKRTILKKPKVDAIIVNGEGTIHRAEERKFAMALASLAKFAEKNMATPCYLVNATLHKNSPRVYELISHYRAVYVRDQKSLQELNAAGVAGKYVPDLTFAGDSKAPAKAVKGACVIDSAVKEDSAALKDYAEEQKIPFRSMIVARPGNAKFIRSPRPYVKNVYRWLKSERRISTDPDAYISYLREHSLVITGRYHTVTMCVKNQIPFVALESNTPKVNSLLTDIFSDASRSMKMDDVKEVRELPFSDQEVHDIEMFCDMAKQAIQLMIRSIATDIASDKVNNYSYV